MEQIAVGIENIEKVFIGEMGIKEILIGDTVIQTRTGGYIYIELDTTQN